MVVEWCGRAGVEGKNKTELPKQALRTKLKNESCLTPLSVANGSATGQTREAGKQSAAGAVQFTGGGEGKNTQ